MQLALSKQLFIILVLVVVIFADSTDVFYKNGLGWDDGISYRRRLSDTWTIGLVFNGDLSQNENSSNKVTTIKDLENNPDTTIIRVEVDSDSLLKTTLGVEIGGYYLLYTNKTLSLESFVKGGYDLTWSDEPDNSDLKTFENRNQSFSIKTGIEPSLWILGRCSFSTRFGIRYVYNVRSFSSDNANNIALSYYRAEEKEDESTHTLEVFGPHFSLLMNFAVHYYF